MAFQNLTEDEYFNRLDDGIVLIELDGETHELVPTLAAAQVIGSRWTGLSKPWDNALEFDIDTMVFVIAAGLGTKPDAKLAAKVFSTGLVTLKNPVIAYLGALVNGGKVMDRHKRVAKVSQSQPAPTKASAGNEDGASDA